MAMSKGTCHYNRQVWEDSQFPILCETCLGENPYVRMMVDRHGGECKVCSRPFTTYRWCPGAKMRYKRTEICQTCAKAKNVCQTCLLDLQFGLPVQVRDQVMNIKQNIPQNEINREFYSQNLNQALANSDDPAQPLCEEIREGMKSQPASDVLAKLARHTPYYKRNAPHICSFWVKGECKRGAECPYRHEKPTDPEDPLSDQNLKDRYFGTQDPVAEKLLKRAQELPKPIPPEDSSITTLYVGNIGEKLTEQDLRDYFYQFGEIRSINVVRGKGGSPPCAFITYTTRTAAESAVEKSYQKLIIHGQKLVIRWGRSQGKRGVNKEEEEKNAPLAAIPGLPTGAPGVSQLYGLAAGSSRPSNKGPAEAAASSSKALPKLPPPIISSGPKMPGPSTSASIYYPSQDPNRMGSGVKAYYRKN